MSLDIYLFKNGFDIQKSRADIAATYTKLQVIKDELVYSGPISTTNSGTNGTGIPDETEPLILN